MGLFDFFKTDKKEALDKGLEKTKESVLKKIARSIAGKSKVDDEVLDNLEEILNGEKAVSVRTDFYEGRLPYFCINCPFITNQELQMLKVEHKEELYRSPEYRRTGGDFSEES